LNVLARHSMLSAETAIRGPAHYLLESATTRSKNPARRCEEAA
jgi:hypothetical protein